MATLKKEFNTVKNTNDQNTISKQGTKPILWSISGADCSGGAGIAADIKTGHSLGVEVCHLITANTVQNANMLLSVNPTDIKILAEQAQALRFDKTPQVIKIGLIANDEQVNWLIDLLSTLKQEIAGLLVVYDPVGQASVGGKLSNLSCNLLLPLLPLIDVITPNLMEAKQLSQYSQSSQNNSKVVTTNTATNDSAENNTQNSTENNTENNNLLLAEKIAKLGCTAVIVKGGHQDNNKLDKQCLDTCLQTLPNNQQHIYQLQSPYIDTSYSHGGGCSFASALSCFMAHNYLLRDAFTLTKAYINQGLTLSKHQQQRQIDTNNSHLDYQHYYGAFEQGTWPTNAQHFPKITGLINQKYQHLPAFPTLNLAENERLGLYPVVDSLAWLARLLPLNIKIMQLRIKNKSDAELDVIIKEAITLAQKYQCRLFINDYWQLAIKHGAYGVHIGQEDLTTANLNAISTAGLRLGISTHGCYEFLLAQQLQPSYLAIGAIFPTKTKNMTGQIQGIDNLEKTMRLATNIPVVAIGGINQQRAVNVWATKVSAVAIVTAITEAEQPVSAAKTLQAILS